MRLSTAHGPAMITIPLAADLDPVQREDRVVRAELARGNFVGARNGHNPVDARQDEELVAVDRAAVANRADNGALFAAGEVRAQAGSLHPAKRRC